MEENKKIKEASNELEYLTGDEAIRRKAFLREKAIKDYVTNIEGAREEGKIEGKKEEKISIAKKLLKENLEIRTIAIATGLTEEQIKELTKDK